MTPTYLAFLIHLLYALTCYGAGYYLGRYT